jgi:hypothetical protein
MTTDDRSTGDTRELRKMFYAVKTDVAVLSVGLQNLEKAQEKTNKILLGIAMLIGGTVVTALMQMLFKGGLP